MSWGFLGSRKWELPQAEKFSQCAFFHKPQDSTLSQLLEHQLGNAGPTSDWVGLNLDGLQSRNTPGAAIIIIINTLCSEVADYGWDGASTAVEWAWDYPHFTGRALFGILEIWASKGGAGLTEALGYSGSLGCSHGSLVSLFGDKGRPVPSLTPPVLVLGADPQEGAGFRHRGSAFSGPVL